MTVLAFPGSPTDMAKMLRNLADDIEANGARHVEVAALRPDGSCDFMWSGNASFIERLGLLETAKSHIHIAATDA